MNEVDELDVQVGRKEPEPAPPDSLRPDHTEKYTSVLINGFPKTGEEKDIYDILIEGGLPADYEIENITKNNKNGQLIIENLDSTVCVSLTNHIHKQKFFNKKVFVTSVVQKTPTKNTEQTEENVIDVESCSNNLVASSAAEDSEDSETETETPSTATKPPCNNLFTTISGKDKRPAEGSPEQTSGNKNKDKKKKDNAPTNAAVRSSSRQGNRQTQKQ